MELWVAGGRDGSAERVRVGYEGSTGSDGQGGGVLNSVLGKGACFGLGLRFRDVGLVG